MKNLICMLGIHSPDKYSYVEITRTHTNGKKYHKNYLVCKRCGKMLFTFSKKLMKNKC